MKETYEMNAQFSEKMKGFDIEFQEQIREMNVDALLEDIIASKKRSVETWKKKTQELEKKMHLQQEVICEAEQTCKAKDLEIKKLKEKLGARTRSLKAIQGSLRFRLANRLAGLVHKTPLLPKILRAGLLLMTKKRAQ